MISATACRQAAALHLAIRCERELLDDRAIYPSQARAKQIPAPDANSASTGIPVDAPRAISPRMVWCIGRRVEQVKPRAISEGVPDRTVTNPRVARPSANFFAGRKRYSRGATGLFGASQP